MNQETNETERSPTELTLFAIAFLGVVLSAGGIVLLSAGLAIVGLVVLSLGLGGLWLRQFLGE